MDFTIDEFCIEDKPIPVSVADKLLKYHILPMQLVRDVMQIPIWASKKSGYRSEEYEKSKGRSGNSQHCFKGKGAVDWTTATDFIPELIENIMKYTNYTRVTYYPNNNFIHCDFKPIEGKRQYFECASPTSKWVFKKHF